VRPDFGRARSALYEVREAGLLTAFGFGGPEVDGDDRVGGLASGEDRVDEVCSVAGVSAELAQPLGDAFGRFESGVEGVLCEQFLGAVVEYGLVGAAAAEFGAHRVGVAGCVAQGGSPGAAGDLPLVVDAEPEVDEHLVEPVLASGEQLRVVAVVDRGHASSDLLRGRPGPGASAGRNRLSGGRCRSSQPASQPARSVAAQVAVSARSASANATRVCTTAEPASARVRTAATRESSTRLVERQPNVGGRRHGNCQWWPSGSGSW
jgi:hypothetical protein